MGELLYRIHVYGSAQRWKFIHNEYLTLNFFASILLLDLKVVEKAKKVAKIKF